MITITRIYRFESAHFLPRVPDGHKCGRMHGHSYELTIEVAGEVGDDGWVMDFADVDAVADPLVKSLDHRCLNNFIENPTSENLAAWIASKLSALNLASVTVSETPRSRARWTP